MQKKKSSSTKVDENNRTLKKKLKESSSCPYLKQSAIEELKNEALLHVQDVEDLVKAGEKMCACPYYATRKAAKDAEIIFIPYNTLLHKATREANEVQLKNNIIVIDEAHNLLESLAQMYSAELQYNHVHYALLLLKLYKSKFNAKFSAKNLLLINQLLFVISQLEEFMGKLLLSSISIIFILVFEITKNCGWCIKQFNPFKGKLLIRFIEEHKLELF